MMRQQQQQQQHGQAVLMNYNTSEPDHSTVGQQSWLPQPSASPATPGNSMCLVKQQQHCQGE
jgi:hypothetical protein